MQNEKWNKSIALLREGNYDGWPRHEWIHTGDPSKKQFEVTPSFGLPIWNLEHSRVLVNADFGMGDTIHFWRYFLQAQNRASQIFLRADEDFKTLLDCVVSKDEPIPEADHVVHMMALPGLLGNPPISGKPYLQPKGNGNELTEFMNDVKFFKIGICWSGNPFNPRDAQRSIPTTYFESLHRLINLPLFALVKHYNAPTWAYDIRKYMTDWNQTAHIIKKMDLVISVDTAIAHLAGALGVPVWLLIPQERDWRWNGTCWYDSMEIFQDRGNWDDTFELVKSKLKSLDHMPS